MTVHCEGRESGSCDGPLLAYALEGDDTRIAVLCAAHRKLRTDIVIRDWGELAFPAARTEELVGLYRAWQDAKQAFVQCYDDGAKCHAARGDCGGRVASYYFSDGSVLPVCEAHREESCALMSTQHYDEVYRKKLALSRSWSSAAAESRDAAAAKK
jgi:hypothetical protein